MSLYHNSINRAIIGAKMATRPLPYKCAMVGHSEECGLIHILAFVFDENGHEYATYFLPGTNTRGWRYLDTIPEYQIEQDRERREREQDQERYEQERIAQRESEQRAGSRKGTCRTLSGDNGDEDYFIPSQTV